VLPNNVSGQIFHKSKIAKMPNDQAQPPPLRVTPECNPDNRIS
jgi:hypothetical protein